MRILDHIAHEDLSENHQEIEEKGKIDKNIFKTIITNIVLLAMIDFADDNSMIDVVDDIAKDHDLIAEIEQKILTCKMRCRFAT